MKIRKGVTLKLFIRVDSLKQEILTVDNTWLFYPDILHATQVLKLGKKKNRLPRSRMWGVVLCQHHGYLDTGGGTEWKRREPENVEGGEVGWNRHIDYRVDTISGLR
jgi:hypothetical protein